MIIRSHTSAWDQDSLRLPQLFLWLAVATSIPLVSAAWPPAWLHGPNQIPLAMPPPPHTPANLNKPDREHEFTLRHIFHHGTHLYPGLHVRRDLADEEDRTVDAETVEQSPSSVVFRAKSYLGNIERLSDRNMARIQTMYRDARARGGPPTLEPSAWTMDEVPGPNTTDKETVISLAKMAWNAYQEGPGQGEWQDMNKEPYNFSQSFGWEGDGLRGHVFADKDNSTIIVSLKGTTPAVFDGSGTTTNDKVNDNLFFSCCCGQGGKYLWHTVCDCMSSAYTCNQTCVVRAMKEENRYYASSLELYGNITQIYPNSQVWMVGHSLGGSTGSLLGLTLGLPVTTFEAPGEALAAARLGLPAPPGSQPSAPQLRKYTGAVHFGHTADPIFMGTCNAATSACTLGGYAMQTVCHTGRVCIYDTVADKSWRVGAGYHKIASVVHDVLEAYDEVAPCRPDDECVDCFNWKYFESNSSETSTTTSSSTTSSPTRTTTCQTPGWWGCLDSTTTSLTSTTTTSSSELPTTSCLKYGWFGGCVEGTTLTASPETTTAVEIPWTTSCAKHGWFGFGCYSTVTMPLEASITTSCIKHGWLGGCVVSTTVSALPTSCVKHGWWGFGPCISTSTFSPQPTPAQILAAPTITTTRPLPTTGDLPSSTPIAGL